MQARIRRGVLVVAMLLPQVALAKPTALVSASPPSDSVAQGAPSVVELGFSGSVRPLLSRIVVRGPDGRRADANDLHLIADDRHLAVSLRSVLPGRYTVNWRVMDSIGSYGFTIAP